MAGQLRTLALLVACVPMHGTLVGWVPATAGQNPQGAIAAKPKSLALTPAEIENAITEGTRTKKPEIVAVMAVGNFMTILQGPYARVVSLAAEAATKYQPFAAKDISTDVLKPHLEVQIHPHTPATVNGHLRMRPIPSHVVILPSGSTKGAVQPLKIETYDVPWTNSFGARFTGRGLIAHFELSALPLGELVVVVVTDQGEERYLVGADQRQRVR